MPAPASPTLSATSSTASTTATVIDSHPNPKSLINLGKQLKYLSIGLVLTSYFQVYSHLADALSFGISSSSSAQLALLSIGLLVTTVLLFTYVLLLPARGYNINYADWRRDAHLSTAIPLLTASILLGWTTLLITLSPIGAPAPPASSFRQRLAQAASFTGLDSLHAKINAIPASYFPPSPPLSSSSDFTASISKLAHKLTPAQDTTPQWDKIASYLSPLSSTHKAALHHYFEQLSSRADEWRSNNIKTIGWTGALLASIGSYLLVFGSVGLIGFLAPDTRPPHSKSKSF